MSGGLVTTVALPRRCVIPMRTRLVVAIAPPTAGATITWLVRFGPLASTGAAARVFGLDPSPPLGPGFAGVLERLDRIGRTRPLFAYGRPPVHDPHLGAGLVGADRRAPLAHPQLAAVLVLSDLGPTVTAAHGRPSWVVAGIIVFAVIAPGLPRR
jgi:hypothetical protein